MVVHFSSHPCARFKAALSAVGSRVMACVWILGIVVGVQGWTPMGANWLVGSGRSLWSTCGSAMCACPLEVKTRWQNEQRLAHHQPIAGDFDLVSTDADEDDACPLCATSPSTPQPATPDTHATKPAPKWGLMLVALGDWRPEHSPGDRSTSEPLIIDLPPVHTQCLIGDACAGRIDMASSQALPGRCQSPEPPPPRMA